MEVKVSIKAGAGSKCSLAQPKGRTALRSASPRGFSRHALYTEEGKPPAPDTRQAAIKVPEILFEETKNAASRELRRSGVFEF
jgi:hypothetical protein